MGTVAAALQFAAMAYFLKLLGLSDEGLPETWWKERPEIVTGVFFSKRPRKIQRRDRLIYYAVGGSKRIVAEAEVMGEAAQDFESPPHWTPERRKQFSWRMPVRLLAKCPANDTAPLTSDYYEEAITGGSYRSLSDEQGERMSEAIRKCSEA
jgi:hypothetical protein